METIHFETMTLVGFGVEGAMMILLPIIVLLVWRKKTKGNIMPTIVGAVTFFVSALVLEQIPIFFLLSLDSPVSRAINASVWLRYLVGAILAGLFEETGRFVAYRYFLKKYTAKQTAISYSIGHGGIESFFIGVSVLSYIALGVIVNNGGVEMITQGMEGAYLEMAIAQLEGLAAQTFGACMLGVWERVFAIVIQIGMSMLVFRAVRDKKCIWMYPLAILLHAVIDFTIAFYQAGLISMLVLEILLTVMATAALIPVYYFVYKPMSEVVSE